MQTVRLTVDPKANRVAQGGLDDVARAVGCPVALAQKRLDAVEVEARRVGGDFVVIDGGRGA
ncbi:MAG TPA: hypothetical protein VJB57_09150 [Dehalococcoidia bacterium]|nr:hypothetical protein [Dehalococcoidia bacterium]